MPLSCTVGTAGSEGMAFPGGCGRKQSVIGKRRVEAGKIIETDIDVSAQQRGQELGCRAVGDDRHFDSGSNPERRGR
jgi:hypothetical protein